jgi:hypothetical protein
MRANTRAIKIPRFKEINAEIPILIDFSFSKKYFPNSKPKAREIMVIFTEMTMSMKMRTIKEYKMAKILP